VIVHEFSQRHGSGGAGRFRGGDGCIRDIEFTRQVDCAILSQRRTVAPYGMRGGLPGEKGLNVWKRNMPDGSVQMINLGGMNECVMNKGDHIIICEWRMRRLRSAHARHTRGRRVWSARDGGGRQQGYHVDRADRAACAGRGQR